MHAILDFIGWTDPTRRAVLLRSGVALVGYLIHTGQIPIPAFFYEILSDPGLAPIVGAFLIPAGKKNAT